MMKRHRSKISINSIASFALLLFVVLHVVMIPWVSLSDEHDIVETKRTSIEGPSSSNRPSSMTQAHRKEETVSANEQERPKRHVILLGAHERFNFGDLLSEKIVSKLLKTRLGYRDDEIIRAATVPRDMSSYGGYHDIVSMKQAQSMSRTSPFGPFDIIYTGGETLGCKNGCAQRMLDTFELRRLEKQHRIYDCAYVVPKDLLLPLTVDGEPDRSVKNVAIANSLGAYYRGVPECTDAVDTADYISFRDTTPLAPDSIVMVKELYGDLVSSTVSQVRNSLFPNDANAKYIAVQFSFYFGYYDSITKNENHIPGTLDELARNTDCTIVLYATGTAPDHDNIDFYKKVAAKMNESVVVYEGENVWESVAVIAGAEAVVGTSLHARMMAFVYHKPRVTWCDKIEDHKFIGLWDAPNERHCDDILSTWDTLEQYWGDTPTTSQDATIASYEDTIEKYMESFDSWSKLLNE